MKRKLAWFINTDKHVLYNHLPYKSLSYYDLFYTRRFVNLAAKTSTPKMYANKRVTFNSLLEKRALSYKLFTPERFQAFVAWRNRRDLQNDVSNKYKIAKRLKAREATMNLRTQFKYLNNTIVYDKGVEVGDSQKTLQDSLMHEVFTSDAVQKVQGQNFKNEQLFSELAFTQDTIKKALPRNKFTRTAQWTSDVTLKLLNLQHRDDVVVRCKESRQFFDCLDQRTFWLKTFPRTLRWKAICLFREKRPFYWQQRRIFRKTTKTVKQGLALTTRLYNEYKWSNHEFIGFHNIFDDVDKFIIDFSYLKYMGALPNTTGNSNVFFRKKLDYVTHIWGADSTALSNVIGAPNYIFNKKFYNFFDTKALKYKHFFFTNADVEENYNQSKLNSLTKRFKVDFTKSTAWFINRFVIHGKQRKSAKAFATALSWFNIFSKMQTVDFSQLHAIMNNNFMCTGGFVNEASDYTRIQYKFSTNTGVTMQRLVSTEEDLFFTFSSGQRFLRQLWFMSPLYIMYVKRVDKRRYKNSRGKSGRYEMVLCRINKRRRIPLCLQTIKYDWVSHGDRTFATRFFRIMYLMFLNPEGMYCHKLSAKALFKYNERL